MAILKYIFISSLLAVPAVAVPLEDVSVAKGSPFKRTNPSIDPGFNDQEKRQLSDGFRDAMQLASYAVISLDDDLRRGIFNKYFNEGYRDLVRKVFMKILGDPQSPYNPDPTGSQTLGAISVRQDFPDESGNIICVDKTWIAALRKWNTDNPDLIKIDCDFIGDRVTWRMDTMGCTLLHEYTHFAKLVDPPFSKGTEDQNDGYGCVGARNIDKSLATNNADSFTWYANEVLWTMLCAKSYADPQPGDEDDPSCGNTVCRDGTWWPAGGGGVNKEVSKAV